MRGKIYSLEELEKALPLVRSIVGDLVGLFERLREELDREKVDGTSELTDRDLLRLLSWETRDLVDEVRACVDELSELGIYLRDPDSGLVEAYGERDGEIVYYSWKLGEDRIGYWHGLFGSPRERRPVRHALV